MSKKKSFSGSTMTLRDFHGGSIPSDLPLPSAPGMVVERKNHDRPNSGGWMGSSLHRGYGGERGGFLRQGSGNFARSFEEKASYLPNPANIGRNYDEDERKPVDGHTRRGQVAESFDEQMHEQRQVGHERLPERYSLDNRGSYTALKYLDSRSDGYAHEDFGLVPVGPPKSQSQDFQRHSMASSTYTQDPLQAHSNEPQDHPRFYQSQSMNSGPRQSSQQHQESVSPWRQNGLVQQPVTLGTAMDSGSGVQNVWTARREGELNRTYSAEFGVNYSAGDGRAQVAGSRIAQASALEKVSSGGWNSRILHPSNEPPQGHPGEYGQPHSGPYERGSSNSPFNNVDQAAYNDSIRNEFSRAVYMESGRGIDTVQSRDARFHMGQDSLHDTRREQFVEGRGMTLPESGRYIDDRFGYGEIGWKGNAGQRDSARFVGTEGGAYVELGYTRGPRDPGRFGGNEAVPYVEVINNSQNNSGWIQPEPSPRRDYADGRIVDANRGVASDIERRGFSSHDSGLDNEFGLSSYKSYGFEGQRGAHPDGPYHAYGKEEVGASGCLKGRDKFSQEISELPKGGRFNDRNRGPVGTDFDLSQTGRLRSPGGVCTSTAHESDGSANALSSECESKGVPAERPKLKLLPRTKPLEVDSMEEFVQEGLQEHPEISQLISASPSELATGAVSAATVTSRRSGNEEEPTQLVEGPPKLNLKPRSQPTDVAPDNGSVKERMSLFGGARPRELVLKERGVDESVIVGVDPAANPESAMSGLRTPSEGNRINGGGSEYGAEKQDKLKEKKLDGRRSEQQEIWNARQSGRHDSSWMEWNESRGRKERTDLDKKEDRRGTDYRHLQERRESDRPDVDKQDSWRRSTEISSSSYGPQSPMPVGAGEISFGGSGRVAISSAAELAQAFSRSASFGSGPVATPQGQRSPMPRNPGSGVGWGLDSPGHYEASPEDVPFSRLTEALSPGPRDSNASGVQGGYRRTSAF